MRQTYLKICVIIFAIFGFFSCEENGRNVDISGINCDINIGRFEKALFQLDSVNFQSTYARVRKEFPLITEVYIEQILGAGRVDSPFVNRVLKFVQDTGIQQLVKEVDEKYGDLKEIEAEIEKAFSYYKYYYPEDSLPEVRTVITAFAYSCFTYEGALAISLDRYMGADYPRYPSGAIPQYMKRKMTRDYIVPGVMKTLFRDKYPIKEYTDETLLSNMIYMGKELEFCRMMLPEIPDSILIEYSEEQMKWAEKNEWQIYNHFVEEELFFETNQFEINRFLTDGPYTVAPNIPMESAPRIAEYSGWKIVQNFIKNNPDLTDQEVLEIKDYRKIFQQAKYKP